MHANVKRTVSRFTKAPKNTGVNAPIKKIMLKKQTFSSPDKSIFNRVLSKDIPPNSLNKLRRRDKAIRRFFGKRISRLKNKKRYTAGIVYNTAQSVPLLRSKQTVPYVNTEKKINDLITKNKAIRDQLIVDNKLFQRNMRLKNDALIEKVRMLEDKENAFSKFTKPSIVRQPLPLVAPIESVVKPSITPVNAPVVEKEKTSLLIPIAAGIGALMLLKG